MPEGTCRGFADCPPDAAGSLDFSRLLVMLSAGAASAALFAEARRHFQAMPESLRPSFASLAVKLGDQAFLRISADYLSQADVGTVLDRLKAGDLSNLAVLSVASSTREDVRLQLVDAGLVEWLESFDFELADQASLHSVSWLYLNLSFAKIARISSTVSGTRSHIFISWS